MNTNEIVDSGLCEQMTGCDNASGFRDFARSQGFDFCEVVDWTSSAGDWSFIVSKDGNAWHPMFQENNWPGRGFTREIDESRTFYGTAEQVFEDMAAMYS